MTQATYEPLAAVVTTEAPEPAVVVVRRPRWQSFLIAIASLVGIGAVALGVMVAGGAIVHAFIPHKHVDLFAAFHNGWVVGVLLGIAVLWLLPPYPGAKRTIASLSPEQPAATAGGTEGGGPVVTVQIDGPGPGAVPRPVEHRGAATSPLGGS
ncbi:MAG: hypothetical protein ACRD6W_18460 [Nitrososphaerales archaeon]